ncbi:MAG: glycosyltransferase [Patescibacteria group bacterium]|nr:glycosyltransferase [Patescibacteria group bacterium]
MKIAIVYDWIDKWGGVERVLLTLAEIFPQAIFYTSYYDEKRAVWAKKLKIRTSFIQKLPNLIKKNRILSLPFYPFAFESFNFNEFDLVISISSSFAKGIITKPKTKHITYLLTPTRFLWTHPEDYQKKFKNFWPISSYLVYLKKWDLIASQRPDKIIAISKTVKERCLKYYQRESEVIYPPFDIDYWQKKEEEMKRNNQIFNEKFKIKNDDFYLLVSRLEPYKKTFLAIKVFNQIKKHLIIIGEGSEERYLRKIAKGNIQFFKNLADEELAYFYSKGQGLIVPQEEDFGYVALEGQFFNCPIIAFKKGGLKETVINGQTGIFFDKQEETYLIKAVERFEKIKYNLKKTIKDKKNIIFNKFNKKRFIESFLKTISNFTNFI